MNTKLNGTPQARLLALATALLTMVAPVLAQMTPARHMIDGIAGPSFTLTAKDGYISTADGNSVYFWGYANGGRAAQYVGPTLIVNQGQTVVVTLNNELPVATSIVFPGQINVVAAGGAAGLLTREAQAKIGSGAAGTVTYTFVASQPGTYTYYSGTRPDLQIEMGLVGALIVRPTGLPNQAYAHADSAFDHEYLFLLTDMDETIHDALEVQVQDYKASSPTVALIPVVDTTKWLPVYWFINGRTGPDTVQSPGVSWLPAQPYDAMPIFHPGERALMRVIGGGRDPHPFHHHGNHAKIIARDGRLLESVPGAGADLANSVFTIASTPGGTIDALFSWTGEKLGWDAYGHQSTDPLAPYEYPGDHGLPFPVKLPTDQDLTFGQMYSGSPFLGAVGALPPGEGGFNPGGFMYMWHSHNEKEIINNNIFPGGMLTLVLLEAWTPLEVTPTPLPTGTVGSVYLMTDLTPVTLNLSTVGGLPATVLPPVGAGWTAPFTWTLAPGSAPLPPGLMLSSAGGLSGTPTLAGTYTFTVIVTDSSTPVNNKGAKALTIVVN